VSFSPLEEVLKTLTALDLDRVQFHGEESVKMCQTLPVPVIKTFIPAAGHTYESISPYLALGSNIVDAVLLDRPKTGDQETALAETLAFYEQEGPRLSKCFLAGGLTPENIGNILENPYAVDVASGVERSPGIKDPEKLAAFCERVHGFNTKGEPDSCKV
jgi:phosphoribosylanthranilate isomerase